MEDIAPLSLAGKWGPMFLILNQEPLDDYRKARTEGAVLRAEREYFPHLFERATD